MQRFNPSPFNPSPFNQGPPELYFLDLDSPSQRVFTHKPSNFFWTGPVFFRTSSRSYLSRPDKYMQKLYRFFTFSIPKKGSLSHFDHRPWPTRFNSSTLQLFNPSTLHSGLRPPRFKTGRKPDKIRKSLVSLLPVPEPLTTNFRKFPDISGHFPDPARRAQTAYERSTDHVPALHFVVSAPPPRGIMLRRAPP